MGSNQTDDHLHNLCRAVLSRNEVMCDLLQLEPLGFFCFHDRAIFSLLRERFAAVGSGSRELRIETDELLLREQINAGVIVSPFLFRRRLQRFSGLPPVFGCFCYLLLLLLAFTCVCVKPFRFVVFDS